MDLLTSVEKQALDTSNPFKMALILQEARLRAELQSLYSILGTYHHVYQEIRKVHLSTLSKISRSESVEQVSTSSSVIPPIIESTSAPLPISETSTIPVSTQVIAEAPVVAPAVPKAEASTSAVSVVPSNSDTSTSQVPIEADAPMAT